MFAGMTIKERYHTFLHELKTIYTPGEAGVITDWIFETIGHTFRSDLIRQPDLKFDPATSGKIQIALERLLDHTPVQYLLNEAWFYKMKLKVSPDVLIPRPETEELIVLLKKDAHCYPETAHILDIGSGSGCISIALKKELPLTTITSIDVSEKAIAIAKENAALQNVNVDFKQQDFLNENSWNELSLFDIIVSNPPYIPMDEKEKLDKNVTKHEPHTALFVPDDTPLLFYEKILSFAATHLSKKGKIFTETHEDLAKEVASLFESKFEEVVIIHDMFGKERFVTANRFR